MEIYGAVEFRIAGNWLDVINVGSLLFQHSDLNACLFGVDNLAGYDPLFAQRGFPPTLSEDLLAKVSSLHLDSENCPSWVLWSELKQVDWDERSAKRDTRITEFAVLDGRETEVGKWLNHPDWASVREALDRNPAATVTTEGHVFRRVYMTRRSALADTHFPLLMKLMAALAEQFGDDGVRLTVWFD